jgi:ABC-type polysaccharide/polyol phosphate export permease
MRGLLSSILLGLERELRWTYPPVAVAIGVIPITASILTAVMVFWTGSGSAGTISSYWISYIIVGAALYAHFSSYIWAPLSAVTEGKATYTFPYVYIAGSTITYIVGRTIAAFIESSLTALASLVAASYAVRVLLGVDLVIMFGATSLALFTLSTAIGMLAAVGLGLLLAAYGIFVTRLEWGLPIYIAGLLMIFTEALFPSSSLPWPLPLVSEALPFTHIIRAARAALIGPMESYPLFAAEAFATGIAWLVSGIAIYKLAEERGRRKGYIDQRIV